ncbi:MAG: hypothetical protein J2P46_22010 [Zavarzinella sp.]|nr:hypothetical protein [Zavarzinella sp.]
MSRRTGTGDEGFWAKVEEARRMSFEEKFLAGPRLFDAEYKELCAALQRFCPYAGESDVRAMANEVVEWRRRVEDAPCPIYTT